MTTTAIEGLRAHRAADSQRKRQAVLQALGDAAAAEGPITLSGIAARAGVSRQFIYSHGELEAAVRAAELAPRKRPASNVRRPGAEQGLRADNGTLSAKVERQRTTIAELRGQVGELELQRQRWLGQQLESQAAITVEAHAELRATCERLTAANGSLTARVQELQRVNSLLTDDLLAVRQALAEAEAEVAAQDDLQGAVRVVPLRGRARPPAADPS